MKKLILSVMLVAFAVAVQAGDAKTCNKDKAACDKKEQVAKSCCPLSGDKQAKKTCTKEGKQTVSKPVTSPKANS